MTHLAIARVRALLITPDHDVLLIRRVKPGRADYWVLPGGGVETTDMTLSSAVIREIREETGGQATISRIIHITTEPQPQAVFLARIHRWDADARTGPEFTEPAPDAGEYHLDTLPLTASTFTDRTVRPESTARMLAHHLRTGGDVFALPDVRRTLTLTRATRAGGQP